MRSKTGKLMGGGLDWIIYSSNAKLIRVNGSCTLITVVRWMCHVLRRGKGGDGVMRVGWSGRRLRDGGFVLPEQADAGYTDRQTGNRNMRR